MIDERTPYELIHDCYPLAAASISPLAELAKINLNLIQDILALAMMIAISSAMQRVERDKKTNLIAEISQLSPIWHRSED